jgi:hypothetical protein
MHFETLRDLGEAMQRWHSSMGDPIYVVGSYYLAGVEYLDLAVIKAALDILETCRFDPHESWTAKDILEMDMIIDDLNEKLAHKETS